MSHKKKSTFVVMLIEILATLSAGPLRIHSFTLISLILNLLLLLLDQYLMLSSSTGFRTLLLEITFCLEVSLKPENMPELLKAANLLMIFQSFQLET